MDIKQEIETVSKIKNFAVNKHGKLINLYISGSHLYGWNSEDSDVDIRGTFLLRSENFLGLSYPEETYVMKEDGNQDIVLHEARKVMHLSLSGNCNLLEEFAAPQLYKTSEFIRMRQLVNNAFGKNGIYNSYRGLAMQNYKKFILQGKNTVKKYLYVFRGLMAGIYCLRTGVVQPNINELNKHFKIPEVAKLLEIKKAGKEEEPLKELEEGTLDLLIRKLFDDIDDAYTKSKIPEHPSPEDKEALNKFLIEMRKNFN